MNHYIVIELKSFIGLSRCDLFASFLADAASMPDTEPPPLEAFPPLLISQGFLQSADAVSHVPNLQHAQKSNSMQNRSATQQSFAAVLKPPVVSHRAMPEFNPVTTYKGEIGKSPLQFTLVGKFRSEKPSMLRIMQMFARLDLKSAYTVGSFDEIHIMIKLTCIEDYQRMVGNDLYITKNIFFHTARWTSSFDREKDLSMVPVWVSMPCMPLQYFNAPILSAIMGAIGRVLRIDAATLNLSRPSVARVYVVFDLLKPLQKRIWIAEDEKENGFY